MGKGFGLWILSWVVAGPAFGWGNIGHGTVAELAERNLTPEAKALVQSILGPEPLAVAAVWPDEVRSDARFRGFAPYHFVEIRGGTQYQPGDLKNAHTILDKVPALLTSPSLSRERKMILLRYLVHVAGDVHQPLHVGNGEDMGANLCDVTWVEPDSYRWKRPTKRAQNLHTVWDEGIIDYMKAQYALRSTGTNQKRWFGYKELADWIAEETKEKVSAADAQTIAAAPVLQWYQESRSLHSSVYPEKVFETQPSKRTYCKWVNPSTRKVENGAYQAKSIPTLSESYAKEKAPLVRLLILKGGLRLAHLLNRIGQGTSVTVEDEAAIIKSILLENEAHAHE